MQKIINKYSKNRYNKKFYFIQIAFLILGILATLYINKLIFFVLVVYQMIDTYLGYRADIENTNRVSYRKNFKILTFIQEFLILLFSIFILYTLYNSGGLG